MLNGEMEVGFTLRFRGLDGAVTSVGSPLFGVRKGPYF